jgi:hypothetical protein
LARSDKVPFRREFTAATSGYVGDSEGFFVGDILSLHMDFNIPNASFLLEGKVGRKGVWENISKKKGNHFPSVDVRAFEYIRLELIDVTASTTVTLFGYADNIVTSEITTVAGDRDFLQLCTLTESNRHIEELLRTLNKHMEIITGEEYE